MTSRRVHSRKLSENLAVQILDLEAQLDSNKSVSIVSELLELYRVTSKQEAIEYYSSHADRKYLHYHKRMQSLLSLAEEQKLFSREKPKHRKNSKFHKQAEETLDEFLSSNLYPSARAKDDLVIQEHLDYRIKSRRSLQVSKYKSRSCDEF